MSELIWNYEDIYNNLLSVYDKKECIGYFRIDRDEFVIITDQIQGPRIHIDLLKQIVDKYPEALSEAKKITETE
tara:strand:+ start:1216 stop:1437 length:222 start_codon:yes stop_codon:yes gene_type:complete